MNSPEDQIELNIDFNSLETLLINQEWYSADLETNRLMLEITNRSYQHIKEWALSHPLQDNVSDRVWLRRAIDRVMSKDWQAVDHLWVKHSSGRFGFSIQLRIWMDLGAILGEDYEIYGDRLGGELNCKFAERVGWQAQTLEDEIPQLTYNLQAPEGHLPGYTYHECMQYFKWGGRTLGLSEFFNRLSGIVGGFKSSS